MAMPKGKKFDSGYCSVSSIPNSKNYRQISVACQKKGIKIGPSNVRNVLLSAMHKIAKPLCEEHGISASESNIEKIVRNPSFQMSVAQLIKDIE